MSIDVQSNACFCSTLLAIIYTNQGEDYAQLQKETSQSRGQFTIWKLDVLGG